MTFYFLPGHFNFLFYYIPVSIINYIEWHLKFLPHTETFTKDKSLIDRFHLRKMLVPLKKLHFTNATLMIANFQNFIDNKKLSYEDELHNSQNDFFLTNN